MPFIPFGSMGLQSGYGGSSPWGTPPPNTSLGGGVNAPGQVLMGKPSIMPPLWGGNGGGGLQTGPGPGAGGPPLPQWGGGLQSGAGRSLMPPQWGGGLQTGPMVPPMPQWGGGYQDRVWPQQQPVGGFGAAVGMQPFSGAGAAPGAYPWSGRPMFGGQPQQPPTTLSSIWGR